MISPNGLFIAVTGKKYLYIIDPVNMRLLNGSYVKESHYCKLTDEHVFIKHSDANNEEWTIVSLKETELIKSYKGLNL